MEDEQDYQALMEEPWGGDNSGVRYVQADPSGYMNTRPLDPKGWVAEDYLHKGGWSIAWPGHGGTGAHVGVLQPDEFVDLEILRGMIEDEMGLTLDEIQEVYSTRGKPQPKMAKRRARLDAVLFALYEAGGNMYQFAEAVGINQRTMNRALVRARAGGNDNASTKENG